MPDTTEILGKLRKDAAELAADLGHELGEWQDYAVVSIAECKNCAAYVRVDAYFFDPGNAEAKKGTSRGPAISGECSKVNP